MKREIPIAGIMTVVEYKKVGIDDIIYDENNPRLGFIKDLQLKDSLSQFESEVALKDKDPEAYEKLKINIEVNSGIINPIWVVPLKKDKYLVIEGNTRLAIYKELQDKYPTKKTWKSIDCKVLPTDVQTIQLEIIKLEAHLRGTNPWDPYEKAKYLYHLWEVRGNSPKRLAELTKLSEKEITDSIQAFLDMQKQYLPRFGKDPKEVFKFSHFVELEKNRKLKDVMEKNNFSMSDFCEWVGTNKIPRAQDVRVLKHILDTEKSRKAFVRHGYEFAREQLSMLKPDITSPLFQSIERVIEGLDDLSSYEIYEMIEGDQKKKKEIITELYQITKRFVKVHFKIE